MIAPAKQWSDSEGLRYFCRHLVGLCVSYRLKKGADVDRQLRFAAYSGTLINIRGAVCFLTAGHVLREVEKFLAGDELEIINAVLADTFGLGSVSHHPIPFDLKNESVMYVDDEGEGLDFGVIKLKPHYVRLLEKNGILAIEEKNWIKQSEVQFDGYAMLGFPMEFTSEYLSESGEGEVSPTIFGIRRLGLPPTDRPPTRYPQFIGQLGPKLPLKSVKGMSGGPILGFRQEPDGCFRYWIVALQSSWLPRVRAQSMAACCLSLLPS